MFKCIRLYGINKHLEFFLFLLGLAFLIAPQVQVPEPLWCPKEKWHTEVRLW